MRTTTAKLLRPAGVFLVALVLASMPEAHATGFLDNLQQTMQAASTGWMTQAQSYAKDIFGALAAIELSWAGAQYALQKNDLSDMAASFLLKVAALGFFYTLITYAPTWMPAIINSFTQMGQNIGGGGATLSPSDIFSQGINLATALINSLSSPKFSLAQIASFLFDDILVGLAAIIVVAAYAFIAMQVLMTTVESYFVIGGGAVMLGFLGSRWTAPFGEKYFGYAVSVGVKLLVLYLIVGLGSTVAAHEIDLISKAAAASGGMPPPQAYLDSSMGSLVFAGMAWNVPGLAGSFMNGTPHMGIGNMTAPAAGIASGAVAAGATAAGGLASLAAATTGAAGGWTGGPGAAGGIAGTERLASLASIAGGEASGGASIGGGSPGGSGMGSTAGAGMPGPSGNTSTLGGGSPPATTPSGGAPQQTAATNARENQVSDPNAPPPGGALRRFAGRMENLATSGGSRAMQHATHQEGASGGLSIRINHPD